jgi:hypothetical protein
MAHRSEPPRGSTLVLRLAAAYNFAFAGFAIFFPLQLFQWAGLDAPVYPAIWQCVGMVVGVYGVGYAIAANDPRRHWPIVLVGLLGKVLGPVGFLWAVTDGQLNWHFGTVLLTNDVVWWVPFAAVLYDAFRANTDTSRSDDPDAGPKAAMLESPTSVGWTLYDLTTDTPRLIVFLRHFGCSFTRETLARMRDLRPQIEEHGASIVFVHMSDPAEADARFAAAGLEDAVHVSDPTCRLYRAFGLDRGNFLQMFGPRMWWHGLKAWTEGGHRIGRLSGDGFRLPGAFLVFDGEILRAHRARDAADHPDYLTFSRIRMRSARWIRS